MRAGILGLSRGGRRGRRRARGEESRPCREKSAGGEEIREEERRRENEEKSAEENHHSKEIRRADPEGTRRVHRGVHQRGNGRQVLLQTDPRRHLPGQKDAFAGRTGRHGVRGDAAEKGTEFRGEEVRPQHPRGEEDGGVFHERRGADDAGRSAKLPVRDSGLCGAFRPVQSRRHRGGTQQHRGRHSGYQRAGRRDRQAPQGGEETAAGNGGQISPGPKRPDKSRNGGRPAGLSHFWYAWLRRQSRRGGCGRNRCCRRPRSFLSQRSVISTRGGWNGGYYCRHVWCSFCRYQWGSGEWVSGGRFDSGFC